jgi:signal transduction histidine kinase
VEQVLRNLLGNAAKYGGSGSTVAIEASATPADVELRVSDEGPGIEEGEAELLFDLFYAMGGRIRAERPPDGGARFIVALPRYADDDIG